MTFGQKIKKLRKEADYTQEQLGEMLSVSTQAVSRWETDAAMPDISLLAPIANLFNVTTDYLLDVDIKSKQARIEAIMRHANEEMCRNQPDRFDNAVRVYRDGLRLYPDSWELKSKLAFFLPICHGTEAEIKKNCEEANALCEEIVAGCPDRRLQYEAIHLICRYAGQLDNRQRALELAGTMPLLHESRDFLVMGNLPGDVGIEHGKNLIHNLYIHMCALLHGYACTRQTREEVGALYRKASALRALLYEDDDFIRAEIFGSSQMEWAEQLARVGDFDTAFAVLNQDLDRILDIENRKLCRFSALSPQEHTQQVEDADIAERNANQRFLVKDYLKCLERDFSENFKKDERYSLLVARYEAYVETKTGCGSR